jgi:hypothetical protein
MKIIKILSIAFFVSGVAGNAIAQYPDPSLMNKKEYAEYSIQQLKEGSLLVRLNFKSKAIDLLEQAGNKTGAEQMRSTQLEENKAIMNAFKTYFTFCPVYFFSIDSTAALLRGSRQGYFLNQDLKVDPSISVKTPFVMVAEFGVLETALPADKTQPEQEESRRGLMADALLVRDSQLKMLEKPFPYYVHLGNLETRVKKLDKHLKRYYTEVK